ncbi:hypothetical protein HY251_14545 [bacterium]|nr:hypothetical protein [bacterium]
MEIKRLKGLRLHVLVTPFEDGYVAHCLDPDLAVQAKTVRGLLTGLMLSLVGNVVLAWKKGVEPLSNLGKAPVEYWEAFEKATIIHKQPLRLSMVALEKLDAEWRKAVPDDVDATLALT